MMSEPEIKCPYCKAVIKIGDPKSGLTCCRDCNKSIKFEPFEVVKPPEYLDNGWYD